MTGKQTERIKIDPIQDDFSKQLEETGRKIAEEKQRDIKERRQQFLKSIEGYDDWNIRVSLSAADIFVIASVLCKSISLDVPLQKQMYATFKCNEEKKIATDVLHKLLLSLRMSSSHLKDRVTHPDYNDKKWHGNGGDIIFKIGKELDTSYKFVDAYRLEQDHICDSIGPDRYRKNAKKVIENMLKKQKKREVR